MVEFLNDWIEQIAIAVIIVSLFEMILPNGNIKKYVKIILGFFIVFNIISPFVNKNIYKDFNVDNILDDYISDNSVLTSANTQNDLNQMYIDSFEKDIKKEVQNQGYDIKDCVVEAVFDDKKGDIGIEKIIIILNSKNVNKTSNSSIEMVDQVNIQIGNYLSDVSLNNKNNEYEDLRNYISDFYEIDKNIIYIQN